MSDYEQIARYYDLVHAGLTADLPYVQRLAAASPGPILELGCGSGRVLLPLALAGHTVTGLDRSPAMLALARQRLEGTPAEVAARVTLVPGEMPALELPGRFALVLACHNTWLHLPPETMQQTLGDVRRHLMPGGRLFLDLPNPLALAQLPDDGGLSLESLFLDPATGERVALLASQRHRADEQRVDVTWMFDAMPAEGGPVHRLLAEMAFHYLYPHQLELKLAAAGMSLYALQGDYDGSPFHEESPRLLVLAQPAG